MVFWSYLESEIDSFSLIVYIVSGLVLVEKQQLVFSCPNKGSDSL